MFSPAESLLSEGCRPICTRRHLTAWLQNEDQTLSAEYRSLSTRNVLSASDAYLPYSIRVTQKGGSCWLPQQMGFSAKVEIVVGVKSLATKKIAQDAAFSLLVDRHIITVGADAGAGTGCCNANERRSSVQQKKGLTMRASLFAERNPMPQEPR